MLAHTACMFEERRREPREPLALPVRLAGGSEAVTRDISPGGMYLEIRGDHDLGGTLIFEMRLDDPKMKFTSEGRIVRVDRRDGLTGIAVQLISPQLQAMD
jgi:hypothetical protein